MTDALATAQPHSVWLVPEPIAAGRLRHLIERLASRYDTPVFDPHITLLGDLHHAPDRTASECEKSFASVGPVTATVRSVERTDQHFMSLFLDTTLDVDLSAIRRSIFGSFSDKEPAPFRPHISLAYGLSLDRPLDDETRRFIDDLIGKHVVFYSVSVTRSAKSVPISGWVTLDTTSLNNSP